MGDRVRFAAICGRGGLGALVLLAGCGKPPPDPRGIRPNETLLSVSGTGRAEATPDQALFVAGISSIAPSAAAATTRNNQTMTKIVASLAGLDIAEKDIQTRDLSVNRIDYGRNRGQFEASNTISVRVRDTKRAGQAIAATTVAGANIVSGPNLSVSDPEKANLSAYAVAYRAARAKAEAYAEAAGLKIARVLVIQDGGEGGDVPQQQSYDRSIMMEPAAPAPAPVLAGTNVNTVSVGVNFALVPR